MLMLKTLGIFLKNKCIEITRGIISICKSIKREVGFIDWSFNNSFIMIITIIPIVIIISICIGWFVTTNFPFWIWQEAFFATFYSLSWGIRMFHYFAAGVLLIIVVFCCVAGFVIGSFIIYALYLLFKAIFIYLYRWVSENWAIAKLLSGKDDRYLLWFESSGKRYFITFFKPDEGPYKGQTRIWDAHIWDNDHSPKISHVERLDAYFVERSIFEKLEHQSVKMFFKKYKIKDLSEIKFQKPTKDMFEYIIYGFGD